MIATVSLILLALLYVLGRYQGNALADMFEHELAKQGYEIDKRGRWLLSWGWPIATLIAMAARDNEPEELG